MGVGILQASIDKLVKESEPLKLQNTVPGQVQKYLRASRRFSQELETISQEVDELRMNEFFNVQVLGKRTFQPPLPIISSGSIENDVLISSEINDTASACSEETRWIWVSSQHSATFSTRGQMRRGSAHGRGGRLPGSGAQVRRNYSSYARTVIYKRLYNLLSTCHDNNGNDVSPNGQALFIAQKMMHDLWSEHENDIPALGALSSRAVGENLLREVTDCSEQKLPTAIEHLPRGIMGIAARFTKSDFIEPTGSVRTARTYNVRERHVIATWVDRKGGVRCTCIGSTQYEIFAANDEFQDPCCMHAQAVVDVLKELCEKIFGISSIPIRILYNGFAAIYPEVLRDLNQAELPRFRSAHGGRTLLLIDEDTSTNDQLYWVPIRKVQRSGGRPLCAFCDLVSSNHCHHVKAYQKEHGEDFLVNFEPESSSGLGDTHEGNGIDETGTSNELTAFDTQPRDRNHQPISFLPLSPVNCRLAIRVDQHICDIMKEGGSLKVSAPLTCIYCEGQRIESTKETNTSGVVMCSLGACAMEIETYSCSTCTRRFSAEGRKEGLFIDSICLAATHKLLRDQLTGFALGNGTISSRLSQFHSQVAALEDSELFQTSANSRSTRSIYNLCVYVVRLMICEPPVSIFNCDTCQVDNVNLKKGVEHGRPLRAICVDGIWAGYQKKSVVPFENISQSCGPPTSFSRSVRSSFRKPKTSFLRLEKTVTFLINAIKGKAIEATHGSVPVIAAAVRIASETALPADFFVSSICGTFPTDYTNDIGNGCLKKLRELTTALFHRETVVYRLLEPLQKLFQRRGKRQKTVRRSTEKLTNSEAYTVVTTSISRISELVQIEEGVAWNEALLPFAKKADLGRKLLQLFTSLLQGPVTHLIRRDETSSAAALGNACIQYKPEDFMKAMAQKNFGEPSGAESALHEDQTSNILKNLRLFAAGLFSASVVDKKTKKDKKAGLLPAFGGVLLEAVKLVEAWYSFQDDQECKGGSTAATYATDWKSRDFHVLREKFKKLSCSDRFQPSWGADYDDPFVTGAYFPSLPQVRPLPFNDNKVKITDVDSYGFCSKHYLQRNASFTPGALTFSCSCSHPKVLGFKVLERDEGPRAVLDVLVSRFASLPAFVIYDFACGVYKSAVNALWWVIDSSTLVSDPFHANNHTCSPAFVPSAHVKLNMLNTVSHEQRNRPIAKIKGSLQQTKQNVYISLLAYQIIINNIEAKARRAEEEQSPVPNRSAKDIEWSFFRRLGMKCYCCSAATKIELKAEGNGTELQGTKK